MVCSEWKTIGQDHGGKRVSGPDLWSRNRFRSMGDIGSLLFQDG